MKYTEIVKSFPDVQFEQRDGGRCSSEQHEQMIMRVRRCLLCVSVPVHGQRCGLVSFQPHGADVGAVRAAQVDQKSAVQMLVVDEGGVHARAALVLCKFNETSFSNSKYIT